MRSERSRQASGASHFRVAAFRQDSLGKTMPRTLHVRATRTRLCFKLALLDKPAVAPARPACNGRNHVVALALLDKPAVAPARPACNGSRDGRTTTQRQVFTRHERDRPSGLGGTAGLPSSGNHVVALALKLLLDDSPSRHSLTKITTRRVVQQF